MRLILLSRIMLLRLESRLDYIAIPVSLVANIFKCWVSDRHSLKTSDHLPVPLDLEISVIKHQAHYNITSTSVMWDKMSNLDVFTKCASKLNPYILEILENARPVHRSTSGDFLPS